MSIELHKGDLFASDYKIVGHGCNSVGVMGAGFALQISKRYPDLVPVYRQMCVDKTFQPGSAFLWEGKVLNLGTQYFPGRNARPEWVRESLERALSNTDIQLVGELSIPKIGCGIGGLDWDTEVFPIIQDLSEKFPMVCIKVYEP
jgi:O-acetyl-ADP-ribose deacetylase (regulator of RNase III)